MSAFSTSETRDPNGSTASVARFTTSKHSSQVVPSSSVNIDDVRCGRPESRTTFTAAATASETEPSARPVPDGATENATIMTEKPPVGVLSCGDVSSSKNSLLNPYPVALDRGEHGVRPVRQPAVPHHPDGLGHHLADPFPDPQRCDGKRDKHGPLLSPAGRPMPVSRHNRLTFCASSTACHDLVSHVGQPASNRARSGAASG